MSRTSRRNRREHADARAMETVNLQISSTLSLRVTKNIPPAATMKRSVPTTPNKNICIRSKNKNIFFLSVFYNLIASM